MAYRHILNFWPLVPAVDIQAILKAVRAKENEIFDDLDIPIMKLQKESFNASIPNSETKENANILIVGDGIGCLMKTVARMHRHETRNLNIYVVSGYPECIARDLLLLSLFTDSAAEIGTLERVEMFLEIFGNTLVRASTASFVGNKSREILEDIVSLRQPVAAVPAVSLTFLKQKEMDDICKVLTFLKNKGSYKIAQAWENSLRAFFGSRYDSRQNLFDYHYNMKLSHYPIIGLKKYLEWCETGIAFKLRQGRYDSPNKTLCLNSLAKAKSSGFYGDIATSPYITFGVECKNEAMFEKNTNNLYVNTGEDVSKFNVTDLMTEFKFSGLCESDRMLSVYFLFYSTFCKTKKFERFFDAIYVTCDMTSYAESDSMSKILNKKGIVVFETVNNVVNSTKDQKMKHLEDIDRFARKNNLKLEKTLKSIEDNFKIYVRNDNDAVFLKS